MTDGIPTTFLEEDEVQIILLAAQKTLRGPQRADEKRRLKTSCESLILLSQQIDWEEETGSSMRFSALGLLELGFIMGSETARHSEEVAAEVRRNLRSAAGREGGRRRLEAAEQGWRVHAKILAIELRQKHPELSQRNLATEMSAAWRDAGQMPGFDSLLKYVKHLETTSDLPKRRKAG